MKNIKIMGHDAEYVEEHNQMYTTLPKRPEVEVHLTPFDVRLRMYDGKDDWESTPYYTHDEILFVAECIKYIKDHDHGK